MISNSLFSSWHHSKHEMTRHHCECKPFLYIWGRMRIHVKICFVQTHNRQLNSKPLPVHIYGALRPIQHRHLGHRVSQSTNSVLFRRTRMPLPSARLASVPGLGVELLADVVDDLGYKFVEVVELVHEEGVLLVGVRGDVLQLVLRCPGNADGVGDHTWMTRREGR